MNQSDSDSWNQSKANMHKKKTTNQKLSNHKTISDKTNQSKNLSSHRLSSHTVMEANQINFDEMISNQDILLRACYETFGNDGNITQPFLSSQTFLAQTQLQIMQPQQKQ